MAWRPCKYPHFQASIPRKYLKNRPAERNIDVTSPNSILESNTEDLAQGSTEDDETLFGKHPPDVSARLNTSRQHHSHCPEPERSPKKSLIPPETGLHSRYFHSHSPLIYNNKTNTITDVVSNYMNYYPTDLIDQGPIAGRLDESFQQHETGISSAAAVSKPGAPVRSQSSPQTPHQANMRHDQ